MFRSLLDRLFGRTPTAPAPVKNVFTVDLKRYVDRPTTLSVLIVDGSTSMAVHGSAPQDAVNRYMDEVRADQGTRHLAGLVVFNSEFNVAIPIAPVNEIPYYSSYVASGDTLLYRTVKRVLEGLSDAWGLLTPDERSNLTIYVFVISDGQDTNSDRRDYPVALVEYAERARRDGWKLACYGLGVSGPLLAQKMGFDPNLADTFTADRAGIDEGTRRAGEVATRRARR